MNSSNSIKKFLPIYILGLLILVLFSNVLAWQRLGKVSLEEYMKMIEDAYYQRATKEELNRRIALSENDWPSHVTRLVKVEKKGFPILSRPSFDSKVFQVYGITNQGEILQYLNSTKKVTIDNPLSRKPSSSGIWYNVRLLNGDEGWIIAQHDLRGPFIASVFNRRAAAPPKPVPKTTQTYPRPNRSAATDGLTDEMLALIKTVLVILAILILFILIISRANKKTPSTRSTSGSSSGHAYGSSSSTEYGNQSVSMSSESKEKEKSDWPFQEKGVVFGKKNIIEKHEILPDVKAGEVKENLFGETEIHKKTWYGTDKVGEVKRGFFGGAKSIETKDGGSYEIKETFFGRKIIVDEDGNEIGEYKGD